MGRVAERSPALFVGTVRVRQPLLLALAALSLAVACSDGNDETAPDPPATQGAATAAPPTTAPPSPTLAPREVTMRLDQPVPAAPVAGQTFTITVRIVGAANLGAYQFSPAYDSAVLELLSVQDGGFLV